jgi:hypothetical protein
MRLRCLAATTPSDVSGPSRPTIDELIDLGFEACDVYRPVHLQSGRAEQLPRSLVRQVEGQDSEPNLPSRITRERQPILKPRFVHIQHVPDELSVSRNGLLD